MGCIVYIALICQHVHNGSASISRSHEVGFGIEAPCGDCPSRFASNVRSRSHRPLTVADERPCRLGVCLSVCVWNIGTSRFEERNRQVTLSVLCRLKCLPDTPEGPEYQVSIAFPVTGMLVQVRLPILSEVEMSELESSFQDIHPDACAQTARHHDPAKRVFPAQVL